MIYTSPHGIMPWPILPSCRGGWSYLECRRYDHGIETHRGGVYWNSDNSPYYWIVIRYGPIVADRWPPFHALWQAQTYVEFLLAQSTDRIREIHSTPWPKGTVL